MNEITLIYLTAVAVLVAGAVWFKILRPMLEDFGILRPIDGRAVSTVSRDAPAVVMSRREDAPASFPNDGSRRSHAAEQDRERPGTAARSAFPAGVPTLAEQLTELSDDELLTLLAQLPGDADGWRFADSRLAKFIGGRIEDRVTQVRAARGTPARRRAMRILPIHHNGQRYEAQLPPRRGSYYPDDPALEPQPPPA